MKKSLICTALITLGLTSFSVAEEQDDSTIIDITIEKLIPEVDEIITVKPLNSQLLDNNRFIALLGAKYDVENYYNVTKVAFADTYEKIQDELRLTFDLISEDQMRVLTDTFHESLKNIPKTQWDDNLIKDSKRLPCGEYLYFDCILETINQKERILQHYQKNERLIQRYREIYERYPNEIYIPYSGEVYAYSELPSYLDLFRVLNVSLGKGILDISEGKTSEGLTYFIEQQQRINQMIKVDELNQPSVISIMIAISMQQILDQYLNALLESNEAIQLLINPRVHELLLMQQEYTENIRKSTLKTIQFDKNLEIGALFGSIIAKESLLVFLKGNPNMELSKEEEFAFIAKNFWKLGKDHKKSLIYFPWLVRVHFPSFLTSLDAKKVKYNDAYTYDEYHLYFMRKYSVASEANRMYLELITPFWVLAEQNPYDKKLTEIDNGFCNTMIHMMLGYLACPMVYNINYVIRADTQRNYHNMVYLKYLILKDNIQDQDIPEFLKAQGEIAIDPITQRPFQWDTETHSIFIPLAEARYLPSMIREAIKQNPDIKNLQVTIPKRDSK